MPQTSIQPGTADFEPVIPPVPESRLAAAVEALVLSSDRPIAAARLAQALGIEAESSGGGRGGAGGGGAKAVTRAVEGLNAEYARTGRSFRIESVAGGYRAITMPEYAPVLAALHGLRESQSLSRAALETLAIIAYRQPITRADIESIRGVASGEILRSLLDKRLIDITGRAEELGRPMLYGTTRRFLESFGLASLKDLPAPTDFAPADPPADHPPADPAPKPPKKPAPAPDPAT